jgi:hypothetical protein
MGLWMMGLYLGMVKFLSIRCLKYNLAIRSAGRLNWNVAKRNLMVVVRGRYVLFIVVSHGGQLVIRGIVKLRPLDELLARAGLIGVGKGLWAGKRGGEGRRVCGWRAGSTP